MNLKPPLRSWMTPVLMGSVCLGLGACGDTSSETQVAERQFAKSVLDDIEKDVNPPKKKAPAAEKADVDPDEPEQDDTEPDEDGRELVKARTSRSRLGKTRDRAKRLRNQMSGGADRAGERAETTGEHYIEVGGLRWEVPEDWQINIPPDYLEASMLIESATGDATVFVLNGKGVNPAQFVQLWESSFIGSMGNNAKAKESKIEVSGYVVQLVKLEGTMTGKGQNEKPFWAMRGAIIEREDGPLLAFVFKGPEDTIEQNEPLWLEMLESMTEG